MKLIKVKFEYIPIGIILRGLEQKIMFSLGLWIYSKLQIGTVRGLVRTSLAIALARGFEASGIKRITQALSYRDSTCD